MNKVISCIEAKNKLNELAEKYSDNDMIVSLLKASSAKLAELANNIKNVDMNIAFNGEVFTSIEN
jgi:hypothetical protein